MIFGCNLARESSAIWRESCGIYCESKVRFWRESRRICGESRRSYKLDSVIDSRVVGANLNGDYLSNKRILQRALSEWLKS